MIALVVVQMTSATAFSPSLSFRPMIPHHRCSHPSASEQPAGTKVSMAGPTDDDACYLFETDEGTKYVCTSNPEELAWHMGLDVKDLVSGVKPDDLDLVECSEEWSHTGTPQWACKAEKPVATGGPDDDACYLFETDEGTKYVCTSNPEELAWHMGLDVKDLVSGVKPDDLDLVECSEEWSHTGTPQWVCKADSE